MTGERNHFHHSLGAEIRYDDIGQVGLYRTLERERLSTVREDTVDQHSIGIFYELAWQINDRWRLLIHMLYVGLIRYYHSDTLLV